MERLTEHIENNRYNLKDLDKGALKLMQFEDFMEEQGFESLEDLKDTISYIEQAIFDRSQLEKFNEIRKVLDGYFIRNAQELVNRFHQYEEKIKYITNKKGQYYEENQALKERWQKLKEWVVNRWAELPEVWQKMEKLEKEIN